MYDSTNPRAIPPDAQIAAYYIDGAYAQSPAAMRAMFPNAVLVQISVFAYLKQGDVLDIEKGDSTPAQSPNWVVARQADGLAHPTLYCNLSSRAAVVTACQGLSYDIGLADPTGAPHLVDGSAFTQWFWGANGTYDMSLCADFWPRP